jgi:PIN domain nuclease of toxin-antitoxin system
VKRAKRAAPRRVRESPPAYPGNRLRLLLDSHVWLWWKGDDAQLGPTARAAIRGAAEVHFSVASAWEIAIKQSLGRLKVPEHRGIGEELAKHAFLPLSVELHHAAGVATLPRIHGDPFDRLLISQATAEGLTLVTADAVMMRYGVPVLDARK